MSIVSELCGRKDDEINYSGMFFVLLRYLIWFKVGILLPGDVKSSQQCLVTTEVCCSFPDCHLVNLGRWRSWQITCSPTKQCSKFLWFSLSTHIFQVSKFAVGNDWTYSEGINVHANERYRHEYRAIHISWDLFRLFMPKLLLGNKNKLRGNLWMGNITKT